MTIYPGSNYVSSPFCWRTNSNSTAWKRHNGIDIAKGKGTAQRFVSNSGTVIKIQNVGVNDRGRSVFIQVHDFTEASVVFVYQHLSSTPLKVGDKVVLGQTVGYEGGSGMTETSYASHCHFEVQVNGVAVYPAAYANVPNDKGTWEGNDNSPVYNILATKLEQQHPASPTDTASKYTAYSRHPGYQNLKETPYTKGEDDMGYLIEITTTRNIQIFKTPNENTEILETFAKGSDHNGLYPVIEIASGTSGIWNGWAHIMYATGKSGYVTYGGAVETDTRLLEPSVIAREYGCPIKTVCKNDAVLQAEIDAANLAKSNMEKERNTAIGEKNIALEEKNKAVTERDIALDEKNRAIAEKNTIMLEKETIIEENTKLKEEVESLLLASEEVNSLVEELNAAKNSISILSETIENISSDLENSFKRVVELEKEIEMLKNSAEHECPTSPETEADVIKNMTAWELLTAFFKKLFEK